MRSLPPKPETPAELAAQDALPAVPPASERAMKSTGGKTRPADPGPPPPLPPDLVIPPKPPLPPVDDAAPPTGESVAAEETPAAVEAPSQEEAAPRTPAPQAFREAEATPAEELPAAAAPEEIPAPGGTRFFEEPAVHRRRSDAADIPATTTMTGASAARAVPDVFVAASVDPSTAALVVKGVTKAFGETRAVDGIDLTVPAGIFYGLVGPNGAGKTTTLSMIAGLLRPDRGSIRVNGVDAVADPLHAKRQMGVLPDRLRTFDRLTGRQLLHYYGVLRGLPSAVVESRTQDLARAFDLSDALGRVVSDYSAGMVKKVMLAGAMIHSPRLLVLDEPFESVDPVSSAIILDILKTYVSHGGTVILSSHGMDLVERVCSRVAVIVAGQVLAEGTVDEVRGELTLEQRFIELAGGLSDVEGLEWLHTFSD